MLKFKHKWVSGETECLALYAVSASEVIVRRKPATVTLCPTLLRVNFYMPSCTDTIGHTKAFDYPPMDHWR